MQQVLIKGKLYFNINLTNNLSSQQQEVKKDNYAGVLIYMLDGEFTLTCNLVHDKGEIILTALSSPSNT